MDKKVQLQLQEKFPDILANLGGDPMQTCMSWEHDGIAVGQGWYDILDMCMTLIQSHINHVNEAIEKGYSWAEDLDVIPIVVFEQVKEKFGELTIYYSGGDDYIEGIINMARAMSTRICEDCGKPGSLGGTGWIRVQCKECRCSS